MENDFATNRAAKRHGLAVTLIGGSDYGSAMAVAARLSGMPDAAPHSEFETSDHDSAEFAVALAEEIERDAAAGRTGSTIVVLEPDADVMEIALVMEHLLESRHPALTRIALSDVVAVTSLDEIRARLFGGGGGNASGSIEADDYSAAEKLAVRLEFASVIVVSDLGVGPASGGGQNADPATNVMLALVRRLNPRARIVAGRAAADLSSVRPRLVRGFARQLGASMGWQLELGETRADGGLDRYVDSFVFRDPRPFHPERLLRAVTLDFVPSKTGAILRSRGLVRLATRPDRVGSWSIAGGVVSVDPTSMLSWDLSSPAGQELVFFGHGLNRAVLADVLADCLLTPAELLDGPRAWQGYADPFPAWEAWHLG